MFQVLKSSQSSLACRVLAATWLLMAFTVSAQPSNPHSGAVFVDAFRRFCLATFPDPTAFDAVVGNSEALTKTSRPSLYSGFEATRQWRGEGFHLAYTHVPGPAYPQCAIVGGGAQDLDPTALAALVDAEPELIAVESRESGGELRVWIFRHDRLGYRVVLNVRLRAGRGTGVELMALPNLEGQRG